VSHDRHLRVSWSHDVLPERAEGLPPEAELREREARLRHLNYGFE
jgi:hypothetical protein